jgi:hypothetical protein
MGLSGSRTWFGPVRIACTAAVVIASNSPAQGTPRLSPRRETVPTQLCQTIAARASEKQARYVTDPHRADERRLLSVADDERNARPTARARIEPTLYAATGGGEWLREGRVLARIISDGHYEPLGIRPGTQILWVDRARDGTPRALMIQQPDLARCGTGEVSAALLNLRVERIEHHIVGRDRWWRSLPSARFFYAAHEVGDVGGGFQALRTLMMETINETCPGGSCCTVCGPSAFQCSTMAENSLRLR